MKIEEYWNDIDIRLEELAINGFVKLPSLDKFDLDFIANDISDEMGISTFKELGSHHQKFLDNLQVDKHLTPKLFELAKKCSAIRVIFQINIMLLEKLNPAILKKCLELTLILTYLQWFYPLKFPDATEGGTAGDLIFFQMQEKHLVMKFLTLLEKHFIRSMHQRKEWIVSP